MVEEEARDLVRPILDGDDELPELVECPADGIGTGLASPSGNQDGFGRNSVDAAALADALNFAVVKATRERRGYLDFNVRQ